jgi:uncharacterized protein (TIGR01777 family)
MKIVIPGGSGQVGTVLARAFHRDGHEVVVLGRNPRPAPWRMVPWDAETTGEWTTELDGADVVINLAGRSVNCRYHAKNRESIMRSRVLSTRVVSEAIAAARRPPRAWLQASTATIYAHRFDAPNDEATGILGGDEPDAPDTWRFSIEVVKAWEREVDRAAVPGTRKVKMRSAMILSPDGGGIFDTLLTLVRRGMGGPAADGRQYISWIHDSDFVRAVGWIIDREEVEGAINLAAPNPLPNAEFMRELRRVWGAPVGLPATKWMLEVGSFFMQTETELILKSRRVVPGVLLKSGFAFQFPDWREAAEDLCARWRQAQTSSPVRT